MNRIEGLEKEIKIEKEKSEARLQEINARLREERSVLLNIISQMFAKPMKREYAKGETLEGFATPNLEQKSDNYNQEWRSFR